MKKLLLPIHLFITITNLFGQDISYSNYDTTIYYYSKTNFSTIDTLSLWNFQIQASIQLGQNDTIQPLGTLHFWRTIPIDDSISKQIYNKLWTPRISFSIYEIKDSTYCKNISKRVRVLSSCVPPDVGGDLIVLGNLILLNKSVCLQCGRYDTGMDYCRPTLIAVFSRIDSDKIVSINLLESQIETIIRKE